MSPRRGSSMRCGRSVFKIAEVSVIIWPHHMLRVRVVVKWWKVAGIAKIGLSNLFFGLLPYRVFCQSTDLYRENRKTRILYVKSRLAWNECFLCPRVDLSDTSMVVCGHIYSSMRTHSGMRTHTYSMRIHRTSTLTACSLSPQPRSWEYLGWDPSSTHVLALKF